MSLGELSDAALLARCRDGEDTAWRALVDRFSGYVYAIVGRGFRLEPYDAEDAFQEVFARLHSNLGGLRDDAALRPWIAQTARRVAIDRLRDRGREGPAAGGDLPEPAELDDSIARLDEAMAVREALAGVSADCREIVTRFFIKDESYRTIAAALGIPSGTIASRISRCLARLRLALG